MFDMSEEPCLLSLALYSQEEIQLKADCSVTFCVMKDNEGQ
jgi:hypothetical protein